jgi:hypothetical protein
MVATLAAKNANKVMVAPMVGSGRFWVWPESEFRSQVFCVGAFGMNLPSVTVKMFSHLIYFIQTFSYILYFQCDLQRHANGAINCITVQHSFIPITLMDYMPGQCV